jgi:hypothetical protein
MPFYWSVFFIAFSLPVAYATEKLSLQVDITKKVQCSDSEKAAKGDKVMIQNLFIQ